VQCSSMYIECMCSSSNEHFCTICLESIASAASLVMLECGHAYHVECIGSWFVEKQKQATCPSCKAEICYEEDDEEEFDIVYGPILLSSYTLRETDTEVFIFMSNSVSNSVSASMSSSMSSFAELQQQPSPALASVSCQLPAQALQQQQRQQLHSIPCASWW
jgi:hypothetical protein